MPTLTMETELAAEPARVWRQITAMPEINREMAPWLAMTYPAEARTWSLDTLVARGGVVGTPLFSSVVLFLGVVPVERMEVTLAELEPGRRFVEASPMLIMRSWRHEREIVAGTSGTRLSDRVTFEARVPGLGRLLLPLLRAFFAHRHARLARLLL